MKQQKTVTLNDVLTAINGIKRDIKLFRKDVKHDITFLRNDSTDLEDHLNKKIIASEQRLSQRLEQKIADESNRLEEKLGARIDNVGDRIENLERIHPNNKHVFPSTASV